MLWIILFAVLALQVKENIDVQIVYTVITFIVVLAGLLTQIIKPKADLAVKSLEVTLSEKIANLRTDFMKGQADMKTDIARNKDEILRSIKDDYALKDRLQDSIKKQEELEKRIVLLESQIKK